MTFQLDTSGSVVLIEEFAPGCDHVKCVEWDDLTPFAQGYVEAMFASICHDDDGSRNQRTPAFSDLAPETLSRIIADCERFEGAHPSLQLLQGGERAFGRAFWPDRNNGDYPDFPPLTVSLNDQGKVVFGKQS